MSSDCASCGAPASGTAFCPRCGSALGAQPSVQLPLEEVPPPSAPSSGRLGAFAKLAIAGVLVFGVLGVGMVAAMIYVVHRVRQEVHEASTSLADRGPSAAAGGLGSSEGRHEDVCRYLSQQDVSRAIGVEIVATESKADSCSYLAVGDQAGMTAKHMAAMGASHGADDQAQEAVEGFASAIFRSAQAHQHETGSDANGRVPVLVVGIEDDGAEQMRVNHGVLGRFPGSQELPGIGDEAFDTGNAILMLRKGRRMIQISYMTCPCSLEAVKPLARKLAAAL
jgi:hypothetical protein